VDSSQSKFSGGSKIETKAVKFAQAYSLNEPGEREGAVHRHLATGFI
jgi:hypothetical protein